MAGDVTSLQGQYIFNASPSLSYDYVYTQDLVFYNGDEKFYGIQIACVDGGDGFEITISFVESSSFAFAVYYSPIGWADDNYRYIDIPEQQNVASPFYTAFTGMTTESAFLYGSYRGKDTPTFIGARNLALDYVSFDITFSSIVMGGSTSIIRYVNSASSIDETAYSNGSWNPVYRALTVLTPNESSTRAYFLLAYDRVYESEPVAPTYQFKRLYEGATIGTGSYVFKKLQDTIPVYTVTVNATGEHFSVSYDLDAGQTREGNVITGAAGTTVSVHFVADDGYTLGDITHTTTSGTVTDISTNSSGDYNIEFADSDAVITFTVATQASTVYTLSGIWVWDAHPNLIEGAGVDIPYSTDVSFVSNGNSYTKIVIVSTYTGSSADMSISYVTSENVSTTVLDGVEGTTAVWSNAAYKTIDFGETSQTVSKEFYDYFRENANIQDTGGAI